MPASLVILVDQIEYLSNGENIVPQNLFCYPEMYCSVDSE